MSPKSFDKDSRATYNKRRWIIENHYVSGEIYTALLRAIDDYRNGKGASFVKTKQGMVAIEVGEHNKAKNTIFITDANYEDPYVERIYKIDEEYETFVEPIKEDIYEHENYFGDRAPSAVQNIYQGEGVTSYSMEDAPDYGRITKSELPELRNDGKEATRDRGNLQDGRRDDREGGETDTVKLSAKDIDL